MTHRYGRKQKALPRKRRPALSAIPSDREKEDQRHASLYCSMHSNLFSAASTFLSVFIALFASLRGNGLLQLYFQFCI